MSMSANVQMFKECTVKYYTAERYSYETTEIKKKEVVMYRAVDARKRQKPPIQLLFLFLQAFFHQVTDNFLNIFV